MITVIEAPEPFVTSAEIAGATDGDPVIEALIAAAIGEIDGPTGSVGRAFGPQTLELTLDYWPLRQIRLPCPPIIEMVKVTCIGNDGADAIVGPENYGLSGELLWFRYGYRPDCLGPVKIQYRAGYDGTKTGDIPPTAKRAVILKTQYLRSIGVDNLFLKASEVEGVGRREYVVSDQAGNVIQKSIDGMLKGLKVSRV